MNILNSTQVAGIVRHLATAGGALLVQHGIATASQAQDIVGGITAVAMVAWSIYAKREAATLAKAADIQAKATAAS